LLRKISSLCGFPKGLQGLGDLGTWGLGDEIAEKFLADMEVR
jgi:hypothetical protein